MCRELAVYLTRERGRTARVARFAKLAPGFVSQIAAGSREAPPWFVPAIEQATEREVRRWHMRMRDWHLIWPELVGTEGAPATPQINNQEVSHAA